MKNNFIFLLLLIFLFQPLLADNLNIESINISVDKKTKLTIFEGEVVATDSKNNLFKTENDSYQKMKKLLKSNSEAIKLTSEGY